MEEIAIGTIVASSILYCGYSALIDEGVKSNNSKKSRGSSKENIGTLLDRIDWSSSLEGRIQKVYFINGICIYVSTYIKKLYGSSYEKIYVCTCCFKYTKDPKKVRFEKRG
jgi:hypothetical protein